jgi:nicotinamidase-related amidase
MLRGGPLQASANMPTLLCVDLVREYADPGRPLHDDVNAPTLDACGDMLSYARAAGWFVIHSMLQRDAGLFRRGGEHARPVDRLEPLASEQVYLRDGLSALSHPILRRMAEAARCEVYLIGFSLSHSLLSTVFDAASCGLRMTLVEEAVGATPVNGMNAASLKLTAKRLLAPFANFTTLDTLHGSGGPKVVAAAWPLSERQGAGRW